MSLSDNPAQFLTAVKTVALKAETFSECFQLINWFKSNIPYVDKGYENDILFFELDHLAHYWDAYWCAEDEIMPALAFLYTYAAHGHLTREELDLLADRQSRCYWMIANHNFEEEWTTYEQFCDKYAAELNH